MPARTPRHITRIRGEFFASRSLHEAVGEFYENGQEPADVRLHTVKQRIVPAHGYRLHRYDEEIKLAERGINSALAQRALRLVADPPPRIHAPDGRPIRIAFRTEPIAALYQIASALEEIPTFEMPSPVREMVLLELARTGLKNQDGLKKANDNLMEHLKDESPMGRLTVAGAHLSITDIKGYPVPSDVYWPS
jgi:hypothetical protein